MSSRLSLSNIFRRQSHEDFQRLTTEFWRVAETAFRVQCIPEITLMKRAKTYTTFWDENHQDDLNAMNAANTDFKTNNLAEIDAALWARTGYVEVSIRPIDETRAPTSAWAHAEFLGQHPKMATFYIQGGGEKLEATLVKALEKLRRQNARMIAGDGYTGNGINSGFIPAGLPSLRQGGFGLL